MTLYRQYWYFFFTFSGVYNISVEVSNKVSSQINFIKLYVVDPLSGLLAPPPGACMVGRPLHLTARTTGHSYQQYIEITFEVLSHHKYKKDIVQGGEWTSTDFVFNNTGDYIVQITANNGVSQLVVSFVVPVQEDLSSLSITIQIVAEPIVDEPLALAAAQKKTEGS